MNTNAQDIVVSDMVFEHKLNFLVAVLLDGSQL